MRNSEANPVKTIAIVAPAIAREGITKQVANQIIGLSEAGYQLCLIVLGASDINILKEYGVDLSSITILELQQPDGYLSPRAFLNTFRIVSPVVDFLKYNRVDVVIAHSPYAHFVLRVCKVLGRFYSYRYKLVAYFHGLQYSEYPVNTWKRRFVNTINKWLATQTDDAHVSVSNAVKTEVSANLLNHPNHVVIYNSLPKGYTLSDSDQQLWELMQDKLQCLTGKFIVLLPNRIDRNKGQLFFLDVVSDFISTRIIDRNRLAILIVGDGPDKALVESRIQESELQQVFILTGILPNAVVQKLMQEVDVVAIPSFIEGLPFVALEAVKANKIILASNVGGIPEIVTDGVNGFTFETGNTQECLEKLTYIYQNKAELSSVSEAANAKLVSVFSQALNIDSLTALLNKL